jgi:hypothetical protein
MSIGSFRIQEYFMVQTDLTDEEKRIIAGAISNNTKPPSELKTKLFQNMFYLLMFNANKLP